MWGSCEGAIYPEVEIYDGLDNDCDGLVDEVLDPCLSDPCGPNASCTNLGNGNYSCECINEYADCDGDLGNGCEVDLMSDPDHCGFCENYCEDPLTGEKTDFISGICQEDILGE